MRSYAQIDSAAQAKKNTLLAFPSLSYAQETNWAFGATGMGTFYTASSPINTRQSSFYISSAYTLNRQFLVSLYLNCWFPGNKQHLLLDAYYKHFPFNFYGIGNHTRSADLDKLLNTGSRFLMELEQKLPAHFFMGITSTIQSEQFKDIGLTGIFSADSTFYGQAKASIWLNGISFIHDTRDNANYTAKGHYLKLNIAYAPALAENFKELGRLLFQTRNFFPLHGTKQVIAFNGTFAGISGKAVPFYFLNRLGGANTMRGYYEGRFRDRYMTTAQVEYRWWPLKHWAFAGFGGYGCVFDTPFSLKELKPDLGAGLRYFIDPAARLSIRLDYAFGEKPAGEPRSKGFILAVSEAF